MKRSAAVTLTLVGTALLPAGCGGGAEQNPPPAARPAAPSTAPGHATHSATSHTTTRHSSGTGVATGFFLSRWLFGPSYSSGYRPGAPSGGGYSAPSAPRPSSSGPSPSGSSVTHGGFGSTGHAMSSGGS